jgi:hypothetical protein
LGIEQGGFPNFMRDGIIADHFVDLTPLMGIATMIMQKVAGHSIPI